MCARAHVITHCCLVQAPHLAHCHQNPHHHHRRRRRHHHHHRLRRPPPHPAGEPLPHHQTERNPARHPPLRYSHSPDLPAAGRCQCHLYHHLHHHQSHHRHHLRPDHPPPE